MWQVSESMGTVEDGSEARDFDRLIVFLGNRVRFLEVVQGSHPRPHKLEREQMFSTKKKAISQEWFLFTAVKFQAAKRDVQFDSVGNTDGHHPNERNLRSAIGCDSIACLPVTAFSNVLQHHCAIHVRRSIIQLYIAVEANLIVTSQRQ